MLQEGLCKRYRQSSFSILLAGKWMLTMATDVRGLEAAQ